ncbi:histone demethylase NDAI_0D00270 [Naumovozyma dairenensis CBS 421]|uniref:JmjC domain-containing protein n=1 Tax=Naumovozyma dairenensis (strain ATCC 10597 / BCRC 20456 / CBS 421 / NBRC 0211 / NRRL Y-12639) TaxID=1071378 RepID=G0W980_NAUDC|nr:hypothetical protein NDAI_0D00270 [Naumovozyma dairenensis CBS 421]CCD24341.1 hypothetical protein NDAI_0D00270 [Naumovozyma dairenensis CBS 421]
MKSEAEKHPLSFVPSLYPTDEEFANPIEYLSRPAIRDLGLEYGILKLIPPKGFNPPLALDKPNFEFPIRIQNLPHLNIQNRNRLSFMKQLNNFHKFNGTLGDSKLDEPFIIINHPYTKKETKLYIYDLFIEIVRNALIIKIENDQTRKNAELIQNNKAEEIKTMIYIDQYKEKNFTLSKKEIILNNNELWRKVSTCLEEFTIRDLKNVFHKYLSEYYDYYIRETTITKGEKDYNTINVSQSVAWKNDTESILTDPEDSSDDTPLIPEDDDYWEWECHICHRFTKEFCIEFCDSCERPFHFACIASSKIKLDCPNPKTWVCKNCMIGNGVYGFRTRTRPYKLSDFKKRCEREEDPKDKNLTISQLEDKFWGYVNDIKGHKVVKYGADIHNTTPGQASGFPNREYMHMTPNYDSKEFEKYIDHPMNLINLPTAKGSLLKELRYKNISGLTLPWLYVGSKFSTFCWHMEDQYTLSANYQHEGSPKIWYSIPPIYYGIFNSLIFDICPDLTFKQPDILHQLISLISPYDKRFQKERIKCYKAIQNPNEYIITFPHCYHSGFNTGYNLNEAVNFTTDFWVPYGINASREYRGTATPGLFDMYDLLVSVLDQFRSNNFTFRGKEKSYLLEETYAQVKFFFNAQKKIVDQLTTQFLRKPAKNIKFEKHLDSNCGRTLRRTSSDKKKIRKKVNSSNSTSNDSKEAANEDIDIYCTKCKTICSFAFAVHYQDVVKNKGKEDDEGGFTNEEEDASYEEADFDDMNEETGEGESVDIWNEMLAPEWNKLGEQGIQLLCLDDYKSFIRPHEREMRKHKEAHHNNKECFCQVHKELFARDEVFYVRDWKGITDLLSDVCPFIFPLGDQEITCTRFNVFNL